MSRNIIILLSAILLVSIGLSTSEVLEDDGKETKDADDLRKIAPGLSNDILEILMAKDKIIRKLIDKVETFEDRIEKLETERNNDKRFHTCEKKVDKLAEIVRKQNSQILNHEAEINELKTLQNVKALQIDKTSLKQQTGQTYNRWTKMGHQNSSVPVPKLTEMRSVNRLRKRQSDEILTAFSATLTNNEMHLGVGQNVKFDKVITNVNNDYHVSLGAFIAPVSGTYVFSASLLSYFNHHNHFYFAKNGQSISRMWVGGAGNERDTSSQTIVIQLAQGDDFSVRNEDADETLHGYHMSAFCGFLLQQSFDSPTIVGK